MSINNKIDPMAEDELDTILENVVNVCFENAHEAVNNKQGFNNMGHIAKAKAAISAYTTNKIIEELEQLAEGELVQGTNTNIRFMPTFKFNRRIAELKEALNHRKER